MSDKNWEAHEEAKQIAARRVGPIVFHPWPAAALAATGAFAIISLFTVVAGLDGDEFLLPTAISSFVIASCVFLFYWLHEREYYKVYVRELQRLMQENRET